MKEKEYYCVFCGKKLMRRRRKFCSNSCKCKYFYKNNPEKCNIWRKNNPKPRVNNKCFNCGKDCGRKKYCSDKCKPIRIIIQPYWKGMARFNTKCYVCQRIFNLIHIHHKDGNHKNNDKENLVSLCASCHQKIHRKKAKRNYYLLRNNFDRENRLKEIRSFLKID